MGGKIDVFVDCGIIQSSLHILLRLADPTEASPYSYFAFSYLQRRRKLLKQYDIEVDFIPFFLGGVNVATGNKPPSTLPAKAAYGSYDLRRAVEFFETAPLSSPDFFPVFTVPPQRAILVVKSLYSPEKFEIVYEDFWLAIYNRHIDIGKPEKLAQVLSDHFDENEVKEILRLTGTQEFKDKLTTNTKYAIDKGAFGAPWFMMRNSKGEEEPLFGSDRWNYLFRFMGVEFKDLEIIEKAKDGGPKL